MLHVLDASLFCPLCRLLSRNAGQVGTFWEDQEPHRILGVLQVVQCSLHAKSISLPFSAEENEVVELSSPAKDGQVLERFLEDDVDAAVHLVGVCDPPEVHPVGVQLVIRHEHEAVREVTFEGSVVHLVELTLHALVAAHADDGRSPPLGDGGDENGKGLLCPRHVAIVKLWVDELQWGSDELGGGDGQDA